MQRLLSFAMIVALGAATTSAQTSATLPAATSTDSFTFVDGIEATSYPETTYDQPLRPQFHFSSKRNWINDPNGMVFDGEKYHLFFQHNPKGTTWGNMTWGHATSPDMIHWTQKEHALLPYSVDGKTGTIYSGTAVMDHNNSLGKQVGDVPTMCAFFTFATVDQKEHPFYQALAYSTDRGKTWEYWNEGRAVVENQGFDAGERDPKVFWDDANEQWVMVLWVQREPGRVRFFTSQNLTDWEFASDFLSDWAYECMDFIVLPVDEDEGNRKYVLYDASFHYEIGEFDGNTFHSETEPLKQASGNFYAAQTFNQAPNNRIVQIGWMRGGPNSHEAYGLPFNQQMAFPCDLSLRTTPAGVRLFVWPIPEIESLVTATHEIDDLSLGEGVNAIADFPALDLIDLEIEFEPGTASEVVFDLPGVSLRYDASSQTLKHKQADKQGNVGKTTTLSNLAPRDGVISLRLLVDRLSVEAYAFGGETFAAHYTDPKQGANEQSIHAGAGEAKIRKLTIRELKSAW